MRPSDDEFRAALRHVLEQTGLSKRGLAAAMGRDAGYVASLLDPERPSRARPTPEDMVNLADAAGITVIELLDQLWGVPAERLAQEVIRLRFAMPSDVGVDVLSDRDKQSLADYAAFLVARRRSRRGSPEGHT